MDDFRTLFLQRAREDESAIRERQNLSAEADDDIVWLAKQPRGKRLLKRLLKRTGLMADTMLSLRTDDPQMLYRLVYLEGVKSVGYDVFKELKRLAPDVCGQLLTEREEKAHG